MRKIVMILLLLCMLTVPVFGTEIFNQNNFNYDCGIRGTGYFGFEVSQRIGVNNISVWGYNTLGSNTTLNFRITTHDPITNFSSGNTVNEGTTLVTVTNTSQEIIANFDEPILEKDTIYWLRLGGDPDVCFSSYWDGVTDQLANGGITTYPSLHDLRIVLNGNTEVNVITSYVNSSYTPLNLEGESSIYYYYQFEQDFSLTKYVQRWSFSTPEANKNHRQIIDLYRINTSNDACVLYNISINNTYNNDNCWEFVEQIYITKDGTGYDTGTVQILDIEYNESDLVLNGLDYYLFLGKQDKEQVGGASGTNQIYVFNDTNPDPFSTADPLKYSAWFNGQTNFNFVTLNNEQTTYHQIQGVYLNSCSGVLCNDTIFGTNETNETLLLPEDVNISIGLLFNTSNETSDYGAIGGTPQTTKINLTGFILSMFIIGAIAIFFAYTFVDTKSIYAVSFIGSLFCVGWGWLPFYIPLLILVVIVGVAIFKYFVGNRLNG